MSCMHERRGHWPVVDDDSAMEGLSDLHSTLGDIHNRVQQCRAYQGEFAALDAMLDTHVLVLSQIVSLAQTLDHHGLLWPRVHPPPEPPTTWRRRWAHRIVRRQREMVG